MNNNQISNPKKEQPAGMSLNEKDYITSLLSRLKEMEKNYTIAMTEASNESLYQRYLEIFSSIATLQRETYEVMFRNGWYVLEKKEANKINQKLQQLSDCYKKLSQ